MIRPRRSTEWQVHSRFAECSSVPVAWGAHLTTMSILRAILELGCRGACAKRLFVRLGA
jgi:hypothetical protein